MSPHVTELMAVLGSTLFTGAAVYISSVEHPARLSCGTELAATEWVPSYKRASVMQVSLALIAGLSGIVRSIQGDGVLWAWASLILLAVIPFTLIVIRPTNNQLLDSRRDRGSEETRRLLTTWGRLHGIRSVLGVAASVLFVWAAVR